MHRPGLGQGVGPDGDSGLVQRLVRGLENRIFRVRVSVIGFGDNPDRGPLAGVIGGQQGVD